MLRWSRNPKEPEETPARPAVQSSPPAPTSIPAPAAAVRSPAPALPPRRSLPEVLLEAGKVTRERLEQALSEQAETGEFLGEILMRNGVLDEHCLTSFLAKYCQVPHLSLLDYLIDPEVVRLVPEALCLQYRMLPIDKLGRNLTVAMVNPLNGEALDRVREVCPDLRIKPILCAYRHFLAVSQRVFAQTQRNGKPVELTATSLGLRIERPGAAPVPALAPEPTPEPAPEPPVEDIPDAVEVAPEPVHPHQEVVIQTVFQPESASPVEPVPEAPASPAASIMAEMASVMMDSMRDTYSMLARRMELFHGLQPEDVAQIFSRGMTQEFEAGQVVFEKGDRGDKLYLILGGSVEVYDGARPIATLSRGDMFGEMALISREPRSAGVRARETSSALVLSNDAIWNVMPREVAIRLLTNIIVTLSARLRRANEK